MGGKLMKYVVFLVGGLLVFGASASAQEESGTTAESEAAADATPAEAPPPEEKKKSPYYKKVQGWLWLEGFAGPSSYDPDQFGSLNTTGVSNAPRLKGPEYGFAVGTPFGGPFFLGWFYRQANYGQYKLMKTGLDMQGNIRIPYVHIVIRGSIGFAQTFSGNPYGLTNDKNGGVSFTGGLGVRIPIVRWISFATTFDWTFVALAMQGDTASGARADAWISGQQFGATFALTFQFIGVR
jgi:hypothetical protein